MFNNYKSHTNLRLSSSLDYELLNFQCLLLDSYSNC